MDFARQHAGSLAWAAAMAILVVYFLYRGVRLLARAVRSLPMMARDQAGAASAEFVITVIPFLLMLFGLMQMALASMARVSVAYAAFCAARAAIVVLPEDTHSEPANQVGRGDNQLSDLSGSHKMSQIRAAAAYAMIPASPAIDTLVQDISHNWNGYVKQAAVDAVKDRVNNAESSAAGRVGQYANEIGVSGRVGDAVTHAIEGVVTGSLDKYRSQIFAAAADGASKSGSQDSIYSVDRALDAPGGAGHDGTEAAIGRSLKKMIYARMATAVTLHDEKGQVRTKFGPNDQVRAKVTYLFYCQIPLANRFAGRPFYKQPDDVLAALETTEMAHLSKVGMPGFFMSFTAEHTLTNQGKP